MKHIYNTIDLAVMPITLQQMVIFLTVAETKGFARAASRLHMTQSAVSKSVAKLEKELGLTLFVRTTREINFTEAGQILYQEWRPQIQAINSAYRKALGVQRQKNSVLHIGILNTARPERYFFQIEERFHQDYPYISLDLESGYMTVLENKLMEHYYDAITVPDFERFTIEEQNLTWKWAARDHAYAIVPLANPLSGRSALMTKDLLQQNFVSLSSSQSPNYQRDLLQRFAPFQTALHIEKQFKNAYDLKYLFRSDNAILLTDQYFDFENTGDFVKIPIIDQYNGIICAWNPEEETPALKSFLQTLAQCM
ncbi:MAG: LysR family transcriptional regulator [Lachnospiraceae bacterium]|nr:LysR family transcriptional regulator [Lachnospiraceae bacterium]